MSSVRPADKTVRERNRAVKICNYVVEYFILLFLSIFVPFTAPPTETTNRFFGYHIQTVGNLFQFIPTTK